MATSAPMNPMSPAGMPVDDIEASLAEQRKREIAMMLLKELQGGVKMQDSGKILAKMPIGAMLMNTAAQGFAHGDIASADKAQGARMKAQQEDFLKGVEGFQGSPDKAQAIAQLMSSRNPMLRAMAAEQDKIRREAAEKEAERQRHLRDRAAQVLGDKGATAEALKVLTPQGQVNPEAPIPDAPAPVFGTQPGANGLVNTVVNVDPKTNKQTGGFGPGSTNINMPGEEGKMRLKQEQDDLTSQQGMARSGVENLALTQRVRNLLRDGAVSGGGEALIQAARKVGEIFGVKVPATGFTDELRSTLGERVLDKAKTLGANPTNEDRRIIQEIMGSIDTDPMALVKLSSVLDAQSIKAVGDFKSFLGVKRKGPNAPLYETADIGINAQPVSGPLPYRLQVAQSLIQRGVDPATVSQYTGIKPEDLPEGDAQMTFGVSSFLGKGAGKLAAPQVAPPTATKPLTEMTTQELEARLKALKKGP